MSKTEHWFLSNDQVRAALRDSQPEWKQASFVSFLVGKSLGRAYAYLDGRTVGPWLRKLVDDGVLERQQKGRTWVYRVKP